VVRRISLVKIIAGFDTAFAWRGRLEGLQDLFGMFLIF
jgi:hypothetical protein